MIAFDCIVTVYFKKKYQTFHFHLLTLEMEENNHFGILFYFIKGKTSIQIQIKICTVYGEGVVNGQTC